MTTYQKLQNLKAYAMAAYRAQNWKMYEKVTNEYMRIEDEECTCNKRLNVIAKDCRVHNAYSGNEPEPS